MRNFAKYFTIVIIGVLIAVIYFYLQYKPADKIEFGITFSTKAAQGLGFDPKTVYLDILNDLKPQKIRLIAYWDEIEKEQGTYSFQQMDEFLVEADKRNLEVILVLGHKQPRWPECHEPAWYSNLDQLKQQEAVITMLRTSTEHFKKFNSIKMWQIENEPFFGFGPMCGKIPKDLLRHEIQTVKSIDNRPVLLTDSGEKGNWIKLVNVGADRLGVTMYRIVIDSFFGYQKYPIPPAFYRLNAGLVKTFTGYDQIIGVELQAEPWVASGFENTDLDTQFVLMNPKVFNQNIEYAKSVGFSDNYLWGVEWWYWLSQKKGDWGMWEAAKKVIGDS